MKPEVWQEVDAIVAEALDLPLAEREAFVKRACAGRPEIAAEVDSLLAAGRAAGDFLECRTLLPSDGYDPPVTGVPARVGAYRLLQEVGHGGMSVVYRAERDDGQFQKVAAVKLLATGWIGPEAMRRFVAERQILANLDHPHICRLLDGGVTEAGAPYLVMEFVDGVRLTDYCREKELGERDRLHLFRQICQAVEYAHQNFIVHRDIKPGNVLVTRQGEVKLMDFGIAKVLDSGENGDPTQTPYAAMTPYYASPEQVKGEPITAQSDIYSLGVLLYELLAGRRPYAAASKELTLLEIVGEAEAPPAAGLPAELLAVVRCAMRKVPAGRYASAVALDDDVRRYLSGMPVRAVMPSRWYELRKWVRRHFAPLPGADDALAGRKRGAVWAVAAAVLVLCGLSLSTIRPSRAVHSVAVLPFENLTGDPNNTYLSDGITEQLTDSLAQVPNLRVVARTSAFQFKGKGVDVREAGRKLGVDAVVEGSLRQTGNRYTLAAHVNRASDGYQIRSKTLDGAASELTRLEREMAPVVLAALGLSSEQPAGHTPDPVAHDLYLQSSYTPGQLKPDSYDRAIGLLGQAIERDPLYADAYAALAETYVSKAMSAVLHPREFVEPAKAAAQKALELDPRAAKAFAAEGTIDAVILYDWKHGEQELRRAIQIRPGYARAHNWLGYMLVMQGRFAEGLAELRTADALDPLNPVLSVARALYMARQYDQSIEECGRMLRLHPDLHLAHMIMAFDWEERGDFGKALAELDQYFGKVPMQSFLMANIYSFIYAHMGRREKALQQIHESEHPPAGEGAPSAYDIAIAYGALGERDKAFQWLDRAMENGNVWWLKVEPHFDPLRADPRFQQALKKIGLAGPS